MNPIPADFNLSGLLRTQLVQICVDEFQVQLHFDSSSLVGHIQGGGKVSLERNGSLEEIFHEKWKTACGLESVIGSNVSGWAKTSEHSFQLSFDSGVILHFFTQEGPYEDFTLQLGEDGWIL